MYRLRTRIAPTPSGPLHLGNAWSFTLTWLAARARGGTVHLRIDDMDAARARDEHLDDIFASLHWLGLDWDSGPRDAADFRAAHSQRLRLDGYRAALATLNDRGCTYVCTCSRAQAAGGLYPGTCRTRGFVATDGAEHALRFRVPDAAVRVRDTDGGLFDLHPGRDLGDFVLRRKNGDPAYQLTSLVDDEERRINFVVRGLDLMPSTGAQMALAGALGMPGFTQARFWHHALVVDDTGAKLSKSRGSESLTALRERLATPAPVFRWFATAFGAPARGADTARDLLAGFDPVRVPSKPLLLSDFWRFVDSGG